MTQAIHLQVYYKVSIEYTSTHIQQTLLLLSTTLLDTKVLHLTMQDYSTAHTFHYRWFVLWERTPSSQKSDLRLVMVLFPTHLLKEQLQVLVVSLLIATDTTEELELTTSCNSDITHFLNKETLTGLFFCASMYGYLSLIHI